LVATLAGCTTGARALTGSNTLVAIRLVASLGANRLRAVSSGPSINALASIGLNAQSVFLVATLSHLGVASWNVARLSCPSVVALAHSGRNALAVGNVTVAANRLFARLTTPASEAVAEFMEHAELIGLRRNIAKSVNTDHITTVVLGAVSSLPSLLATTNSRSQASSVSRTIVRANWLKAVWCLPSRNAVARLGVFTTMASGIATRGAH